MSPKYKSNDIGLFVCYLQYDDVRYIIHANTVWIKINYRSRRSPTIREQYAEIDNRKGRRHIE